MKKVLVLLVSVAMFTITVFADVDLKSMSDNELLELRSQLAAEIGTRNIENNLITDGFYTTGTDIRAGQYKITAISDDVHIGIATDLAAAENGDQSAIILNDHKLNAGESFTFTLTDGLVFAIRGSGVLEEQEKASWAQ